MPPPDVDALQLAPRPRHWTAPCLAVVHRRRLGGGIHIIGGQQLAMVVRVNQHGDSVQWLLWDVTKPCVNVF